MSNLTSSQLKKELNKYVYKMADELVWEIKKSKNNNSIISYNKKELCIK